MNWGTFQFIIHNLPFIILLKHFLGNPFRGIGGSHGVIMQHRNLVFIEFFRLTGMGMCGTIKGGRKK